MCATITLRVSSEWKELSNVFIHVLYLLSYINLHTSNLYTGSLDLASASLSKPRNTAPPLPVNCLQSASIP